MKSQIFLLAFALYILLTGCNQNSAHGPSGGSSNLTLAGPGNGGGGDPRVAAFLDASAAACNWMQSDSTLSGKADACRKELADLSASVSDQTRVPRVYSDNEPALDHGVPKDAVTDLDSRRIHINIQRWDQETDSEQQVTATMEMSLLLGLSDRYSIGKRVSDEVAHNLPKVKPAELDAYDKWAYKFIDAAPAPVRNTDTGEIDSPEATIVGQTNDQIPCVLYLTDKGRNDKLSYLAFGVGPDIEQNVAPDANNHYMGGFVGPDADLQMNQKEIHFHAVGDEPILQKADGTSIEKFSETRLVIELNEGGQVTSVTATSSLLDQPVICNIGGNK